MSPVTRNDAPLESLVLRDLAQVKALADPLRQRLLSAFATTPQTTKQVADCLDENPTKLYHHVQILADAGLLSLVEKRQKRGTTERYYRAAAKQFSVDRHIFRHLPRGTKNRGPFPDALFDGAFAAALSEIQQNVGSKGTAFEPSQKKAALLQTQIRATPVQAAALLKKLRRLCGTNFRKKKTRRGAKEEANKYRILIALYPVAGREKSTSARSMS